MRRVRLFIFIEIYSSFRCVNFRRTVLPSQPFKFSEGCAIHTNQRTVRIGSPWMPSRNQCGISSVNGDITSQRSSGQLSYMTGCFSCAREQAGVYRRRSITDLFAPDLCLNASRFREIFPGDDSLSDKFPEGPKRYIDAVIRTTRRL